MRYSPNCEFMERGTVLAIPMRQMMNQERTQVELVKKDFNVDEEMCQRMVQELAARASNFVPMNGAMKTIDGADRVVD